MRNWFKLTALVAALAVVAGCGQPADDKKEKDKGNAKAADPKAGEPKHGEWWCDEHGIPEDECGMCHAKIRARLKPEEVCPKHPDRTSAQCFVCNPDEWPKSAARYKAKTGQEPPVPVDNMPTKK